MCFSFFQAINTLVADMPRRIKIRLADTKGDCVLHLMYHIEELTDPGRLDRCNCFI